MGERRSSSTSKLNALVKTAEEFDQRTAEYLSVLLEHAVGQTRRFLRETGQWTDDVGHERLAVRVAYELLERFLVVGSTEVPCRPLFLLDSLISKHFSRLEPLCYNNELLSPLGRFLDGMISRAVVSRDALMALYYHLYGLGRGQITKLLGLGPGERQRIYKNYERWRRSGWALAVADMGLTQEEIGQLEQEQAQDPGRMNLEAARLVPIIQVHYRRSEPQHFPCLTWRQWGNLFDEGFGYDYRVWHLALCRNCMAQAYAMRLDPQADPQGLQFDLRVRPMLKVKAVGSVLSQGRNGNEARVPSQRLSSPSA